MRVLVTGVDGYIGSLLGPYLLMRGHDVVGLDTGYYRAGWLYPANVDRPRVVSKDLRAVVEADLAGFEAVVHLAELSNDPLGQQDPGLTHEINHGGSVRLANLARKAGVKRFVYMSSCSVYGVGNPDGFVDESYPVNPQTAYAECKAKVEHDVQRMAETSFIPCFLRNATAYGASPRMRFDIVLNDLSGLAWTTKEIKLTSDGTPWRPLVHALDICQAIDLSLAADPDRIRGQIFNVGSANQNYRVIEIAKIVAAEFPGCALTIGPASADNRSYRVSFDRIHAILPEFECKWTAEKGAAQLHRVFEQTQMSGDTYRSDPYTRLKMLMKLKSLSILDEKLYWRPLAA